MYSVLAAAHEWPYARLYVWRQGPGTTFCFQLLRQGRVKGPRPQRGERIRSWTRERQCYLGYLGADMRTQKSSVRGGTESEVWPDTCIEPETYIATLLG